VRAGAWRAHGGRAGGRAGGCRQAGRGRAAKKKVAALGSAGASARVRVAHSGWARAQRVHGARCPKVGAGVNAGGARTFHSGISTPSTSQGAVQQVALPVTGLVHVVVLQLGVEPQDWRPGKHTHEHAREGRQASTRICRCTHAHTRTRTQAGSHTQARAHMREHARHSHTQARPCRKSTRDVCEARTGRERGHTHTRAHRRHTHGTNTWTDHTTHTASAPACVTGATLQPHTHTHTHTHTHNEGTSQRPPRTHLDGHAVGVHLVPARGDALLVGVPADVERVLVPGCVSGLAQE
jgi:hypothetical protein